MAVEDVAGKMQAVVDQLTRDLASVRTGRVHAGLLDGVRVGQTPVPHLATVAVTSPRTLTIRPWDPRQVHEIKKAIDKAELGYTEII